ncbi:hypothetical protein IF2G_03114 [Cordyceps javanica]|nr:hypothetical protein IF2G_03114 [Cordyceps javanica]
MKTAVLAIVLIFVVNLNLLQHMVWQVGPGEISSQALSIQAEQQCVCCGAYPAPVSHVRHDTITYMSKETMDRQEYQSYRHF